MDILVVTLWLKGPAELYKMAAFILPNVYTADAAALSS